MKTGIVVAYRLIGTLISLFAYLFLFLALAAMFMSAQGPVLLIVFIAACMVLYCVLSGIFGRLVLMMKQPIRHSLKDWIKVNAFISVLACGFCFLATAMCLANPVLLDSALKQHPEILEQSGKSVTKAQILGWLETMMVISGIFTAHCIWTLLLVRRFREFFK